MTTKAENNGAGSDRSQYRSHADELRVAARKLLEPGEVLRELGDVNVAYGDDGPISDLNTVEIKPSARFQRVWRFWTRTLLRRVVFFTLLAPVMVYLAIEGMGGTSTLVDRLIGGRTCEGPQGSLRFTDGSRIVLALPAFSAPRPKRFLAAPSPLTGG